MLSSYLISLLEYSFIYNREIIRNFDRSSLPQLYSALNNLRQAAILEDGVASIQISAEEDDVEKDSAATKQPKLEEAARTIMRAFNFCLNDRAPIHISRKWGAYYVMCLLFKCYIKVCAHIICLCSC